MKVQSKIFHSREWQIHKEIEPLRLYNIKLVDRNWVMWLSIEIGTECLEKREDNFLLKSGTN